MPVIRRRVTLVANDSVDVNLAPFDRFAGRGGRVFVKSTCPTANAGNQTMTLMIGSDVVADQMIIPVEPVATGGPNRESSGVGGVGAPADPITVRLTETAGATPVIEVEVTIENA